MLKQNKLIVIKWSAGLLIAAMVFGFFTPFQLVFAEEQEDNLSGLTITGFTVDESEITTEVVIVEDAESNPINILTMISSSTTDIATDTAINEDPSSNIGAITIGSGSAITFSVTATIGTTTGLIIDTTTTTNNAVFGVSDRQLVTSITVGERPSITGISALSISAASYIELSENLEDLTPKNSKENKNVGGGIAVIAPHYSANAFNQENETENKNEYIDENVEKVIGGGVAIIFTDSIPPTSNTTIYTNGSAENVPSTEAEIKENIFEIYTQIFDLLQQLTQIIQSQITEKSTSGIDE